MSAHALGAGGAAALVVAATLGPLRPASPSRRFGRFGRSQRHRVAGGVRVVAWSTIAAVSGLFLGLALAVVLGGLVATALATRGRRAARAERSAIESAMPDAIELLVMSLHAGYSPTQALARLAVDAPGPVRPAFAAVEQRLHRGQAVADALGELTRVCGRCAVPLVNALGAAARDGLPLSPVLDRLADDAHASRRRNGEAAARRLPVRLSFPLVVCTLPSFVLLAIVPALLGAVSTLRGTAP